MLKRPLYLALFILLVSAVVVFLLKTHNQSHVVKQNKEPVDTIVAVEGGKKQELIQVFGTVDSWEPQSGRLIFHQDQTTHDIIVDPARMRVMVNSLATPGKDLVISNQEDPNWIGAFCQGDFVVLRSSGHRARRVCAIQPDAKTFWGE